ncbi:MAG: hypothetical protein R3C05_28380 [Pirellulaceae bacterium]
MHRLLFLILILFSTCLFGVLGCESTNDAPDEETADFTNRSYSDPEFLESQTRTAK